MIEAARFRQVLGNYPTGVCAITAVTDDGAHAAMIVGTFSSVSLDPPLIGFFPDKRSSTWPQIERTGRFCVNVLAADQGDLCRQLARPGGDKYADVGFTLSANGSPILDSALAWIDCTIHDVLEAGDHYLVLGRVLALDVCREADPLLFFKGRYGGFAHLD
jgi:3-hydroxy-9,10-secoandrosta-1,3,5(10)-triene-9,17-dione monooxygenase reductase component